jgi:hypothetical protein|nr:MAG TPA: Cytadhesin P30/P32 [Caudoviricetes sp.]
MMHFLQSYSCPPPQAGEGFPLVIPVIIVAGIVGLIIAMQIQKKQQQAIEATKRTETANGNAKQSTITFHVYIYTCTCILKTCQLSA